MTILRFQHFIALSAGSPQLHPVQGQGDGLRLVLAAGHGPGEVGDTVGDLGSIRFTIFTVIFTLLGTAS